MHDVELYTICYLRDLLLTPAHRDPGITTFLSCWVYEEMWHGEALGQVLAAHDRDAGTKRAAKLRHRRRWRDMRGVACQLGAAALCGEALVALQMAWGALNEWTTQAGYGRLAAKARHPALSELLRRIMRQEGRHIDYYASQAQRRLEVSATATALTRFALRTLWRPVGSGVMHESEVTFLIRYLFGDEEGRQVAERIDRRVDRLPGLRGLGLVQAAVRAKAPPMGLPGVNPLSPSGHRTRSSCSPAHAGRPSTGHS